MSDTEHPTGTSEQNNNLSGSLSLAENPPGASADNNASVNTDGISGSEPLAADVDDTAPWASRVSLRRRKAPSEVNEEPFCSDCELVIRDDHLLKCSELSCTEKVCLNMYYVVLKACLLPSFIQYHLACRGLVEQPDGEWFCNDDCKENAGLRVSKGGHQRKRRKVI